MTDAMLTRHPDVGAIRVSGNSMLPALQPGDIVLYDKRRPVVEPGAVVVFHDAIHRAIWVEPRVAVWELGDANAQLPVRRAWSEIDGVAFVFLREGRWESLRPLSGRLLAKVTARAAARYQWSRLRGLLTAKR